MSARTKRSADDVEQEEAAAGAGAGAGAGVATAAGDGAVAGGSSTALVKGPTIKRPRTELVSFKGETAIIKKEDVRTSNLQAPIMRLSGHKAAINSVKFDPSGDYLASGSFDRTIYLWNVYGACMTYNLLEGHKNAVLEVAWSADSGYVYSCSADKIVSIWDADTGKRIKKFADHSAVVNSVCGSRQSGDLLVSGSDDGTAKVWDCRTKRCAYSFPHKYQVTAVALSQGSDQVFAGNLDNDITVWDVRKGEELYKLEGHTDTVTSVRLSPDGTHLLSNAMDATLRAWDVRPYCKGNRCVKLFSGASRGFQHNLIRGSWSGDGERVAVGSSDRHVYVWDFATTKLLYKLPGHEGSVNEVDMSSAEPIVASGSSDKTIFLGEIEPAV